MATSIPPGFHRRRSGWISTYYKDGCSRRDFPYFPSIFWQSDMSMSSMLSSVRHPPIYQAWRLEPANSFRWHGNQICADATQPDLHSQRLRWLPKSWFCCDSWFRSAENFRGTGTGGLFCWNFGSMVTGSVVDFNPNSIPPIDFSEITQWSDHRILTSDILVDLSTSTIMKETGQCLRAELPPKCTRYRIERT